MDERNQTGVLLDVDGTLVDTAGLHFRTWQQAFREIGAAFSADDFNRLFGVEPITLVVSRLGCSREKALEIAERKAWLFRDKAPDVKAFPGAKELLTEARGYGLRIGLIASTTRADVENCLLPCIGPRNIVDLVVTSEMVPRGKPHADALELAMETLGVAQGRALMAGDTIYDIGAGVAAGVTVVGVSSNPERIKSLRSAGAHHVVPDLHHLRRFIAEWMPRLSSFATGA